MITNNFIKRHNGPTFEESQQMLQAIGLESLDQLIEQTIPSSIQVKKPLALPAGLNEIELFNHLKDLGSKNKLYKSFIGLGYYNTIVPGVIQRNILENPGWYTSYTPYQAEISQGRLEALLIYQTMIAELCGLPIANASLLDEGTAAAEAMIMLFNARSREKMKSNANQFLVSMHMFPQTLAVLQTRAEPLGIELIIDACNNFIFSEKVFGMMLQYPDEQGSVYDFSDLTGKAVTYNVPVAVAADLLSLTLLTPPGEWGADVVVGSTQRFGLPMGFGGPHAGFFATKEDYKRFIPGRIIGVSMDANGNRALRMALQTREQHIKRERATSNICTAQALLAIMSGMYAVYHGPKGLHQIARHINILTAVLNQELLQYGYTQLNTQFFDTLTIKLPAGVSAETIHEKAHSHQMNFRHVDDQHVGISVDETTTLDEINTILGIFAEAHAKTRTAFVCDPAVCERLTTFNKKLQRQSQFLTDPVFNHYHSETEMMRLLKKLENKDLALNRTMIPLGSCTMKLTAAAEMFALSWPEFGGIHPFVPQDQATGYHLLIQQLEKDLCEITGFAAVSFQPNSGASGEYTGLLAIREYLKSIEQGHRNVCLIPASAHGTNPASSAMAGMEVVVVKTDPEGNIDVEDLRQKTEKYSSNLAALMVTYPSTHGVFEEPILEIVRMVHEHGGQVYMDGANMNAQVGITNPGIIGADVCHLNLHKTFAIPHGGGGPGVGPIAVAKHLVPFLPTHPLVKTGGETSNLTVASAPFGSAMVLTISYAYIKLLGGAGLTEATKYAILNANYLKTMLENDYKILYVGIKGRVAHEMILDCNGFTKTADVSVLDIAKRLMDFGFHAPTVAFPVHGTLMVEPTESEPLSELNRFIEAMRIIRQEIREIEEGKVEKSNSVLKFAPHTCEMITTDDYQLPYSRQKAAFPAPYLIQDKYWPAVTRVDDAYGDRNLLCTCQSWN
ncbi:MAG: aminomethyl-transferring glycine dehydrogenase [Bacteroidales bacterium]|nr:aminomethyl-transferring glycine dehydrogenase [Bacteroidales bacterium]MDZ4203456.1 aminomethyl-transferring glycine dehydrogenase [Bacteroidales bacterium]